MERNYFRNLNPKGTWIMSEEQRNVLEDILRLTEEGELIWIQTDEQEFRAAVFVSDKNIPNILYPLSLKSYVGYFEEQEIPVDIPMIKLEVDGKEFSDNTSEHEIVNKIYRTVSDDNIFTPADVLRNPIYREVVKQGLKDVRKKKMPNRDNHLSN